MLKISYMNMVIRKLVHSCGDVDIETIQVPLVQEILNENIGLHRLFDFGSTAIITWDITNYKPVFQPDDMNRLENVGWTRKEI